MNDIVHSQRIAAGLYFLFENIASNISITSVPPDIFAKNTRSKAKLFGHKTQPNKSLGLKSLLKCLTSPYFSFFTWKMGKITNSSSYTHRGILKIKMFLSQKQKRKVSSGS